MSPAPLLLCLCMSFAQPPADRWFGEDKWKHFFASFVVTSLAGSAARAAGLDPHASAWAGAGVGASVGVWKEIRDHGRSGETASLRDLTWDLAGVGAAAAALRQAR